MGISIFKHQDDVHGSIESMELVKRQHEFICCVTSDVVGMVHWKAQESEERRENVAY